MSDTPLFKVHASDLPVQDVDTAGAVLAVHGPLILQLSISDARQFALQLERAADEVEAKLDAKGK